MVDIPIITPVPWHGVEFVFVLKYQFFPLHVVSGASGDEGLATT